MEKSPENVKKSKLSQYKRAIKTFLFCNYIDKRLDQSFPVQTVSESIQRENDGISCVSYQIYILYKDRPLHCYQLRLAI